MRETSQRVRQLILNGDLPPLPPAVVESNDPSIEALVRARNEVLVYDANKRASAREVATMLDEAVVQRDLDG